MFEKLVQDAVDASFSGWDFSWLEGRLVEESPKWDYLAEVRSETREVRSLIDIGTGGGERLAELGSYPPLTIASESFALNVSVAWRNLRPLGIHVVQVDDGVHNQYGPNHPDGFRPEGRMPFRDESFDVIVSRHSSYCATEVFRMLRTGGRFITQQVGGDNYPELIEHLGGSGPNWEPDPGAPTPPTLRDAGFVAVDVQEDKPRSVFRDIGAIVYYLRAVPWHIVDFDVVHYDAALRGLHDYIESHGGLETHHHLYLINATKPA